MSGRSLPKAAMAGSVFIGQSDVYPAYYTYQLFKMFGTELVYSSSDDSDVSGYAAKRADGQLTIMIVNLSPEEKVKAIRIEGQPSAQAEAWLLDPTHKAENIGVVELSDTITALPQSVTLFVVK